MKKTEHIQPGRGPGADALDLLDRGSWHYDIDADQIVASDSWYRIMGLPVATRVTTIGDMKRCIHPDDLAAATHIDELALQHLNVGPARYTTAFRVVWSDGTVRELRSIARLYREPASGHRCAAGYVIDVTPEPPLPSIRPEYSGDALQKNTDAAPLSDGERECLAWAGHGKTAWETAQIMTLSPRTVEFHLANAIAKLQAANKVHAAAIAVRRGLI